MAPVFTAHPFSNTPTDYECDLHAFLKLLNSLICNVISGFHAR